VQQRTALRHRDIEPKLGGHDARQVRNLLRVLENVLAVARAPFHPADQLD